MKASTGVRVKVRNYQKKHENLLYPLGCYYRVFFIESGKVICYKILKISFFHVGFGPRTEVTMGHLISDQFKMHY